jgi:hypothetical protein
MPRDTLYEVRFRNKRGKNFRLTIMPPDTVPMPTLPQVKVLHVQAPADAISVVGTPFRPVLSGSNKYEGLPIGFPLIPTLRLEVDLDKFDDLDNDLRDLRDYLINPIVASTDLFKGDGQPVELTPLFTLYDASDKIIFRGVMRRDPKNEYTFNRTNLPFQINLSHIFRVVLESTRMDDVVREYDVLAAANPQLAPRLTQRIYEFAYSSMGGVVAQAQIGKYNNSSLEMIPYVGFQQAMFTHAQRIYRAFMRNTEAKFYADNTVFAGVDFFQQQYDGTQFTAQNVPLTYDDLFAQINIGATWKRLPVESLYFVGYEYIGFGGSTPQRQTATSGMMTEMEGGFLEKGDAWTVLTRFVNGLGRKATVVHGYGDDMIAVFYPHGKSLLITKTSVPPSIGGVSTIVTRHYKNEPPKITEGAEIVAASEITTKYMEEDSDDRTQHRIELEGSENDENWSAELVLNNMPMVGKGDMSDRAKAETFDDFVNNDVALVFWKGYNRTGLYYFAQPSFMKHLCCFRVNDVVGLDAEFVSKRDPAFNLPLYTPNNFENTRRALRDAALLLQSSSCLGLSVSSLIMKKFTASNNTVSSTAAGKYPVKVSLRAALLVGMPGVVIDGEIINIGDSVLFVADGDLNPAYVYIMTATGFQIDPDAMNAQEIVITHGSGINEIWYYGSSPDEYGIPRYQWFFSGMAETIVTTQLIAKRNFLLTAKLANDQLERTFIEEGNPVTYTYNLVDMSRVGEKYIVERLRSYLTHIPLEGILTSVDSDFIEDTNTVNILLFEQ